MSCHMSCVTFLMSSIISHIFCVKQKYSYKKENLKEEKYDKVVELVGGGGVINGDTPSSFHLRKKKNSRAYESVSE